MRAGQRKLQVAFGKHNCMQCIGTLHSASLVRTVGQKSDLAEFNYIYSNVLSKDLVSEISLKKGYTRLFKLGYL